MLKKTYKGQNYYVPWSWKNSNPTTNSNAATFRDAMKAQTSYVTNQWVIPLQGISEPQMTIIRPRLMSIASVESIERTKTTTSEGKWSVLVKRNNFTRGKHEVTTVLQEMEKHKITETGEIPTNWTKWHEKLKLENDSSTGDLTHSETQAHEPLPAC